MRRLARAWKSCAIISLRDRRSCQADLWPEHVLFSRTTGRLAGIIDFGDVCIGDPDYDLAFLARRLGQDFMINWSLSGGNLVVRKASLGTLCCSGKREV